MKQTEHLNKIRSGLCFASFAQSLDGTFAMDLQKTNLLLYLCEGKQQILNHSSLLVEPMQRNSIGPLGVTQADWDEALQFEPIAHLMPLELYNECCNMARKIHRRDWQHVIRRVRGELGCFHMKPGDPPVPISPEQWARLFDRTCDIDGVLDVPESLKMDCMDDAVLWKIGFHNISLEVDLTSLDEPDSNDEIVVGKRGVTLVQPPVTLTNVAGFIKSCCGVTDLAHANLVLGFIAGTQQVLYDYPRIKWVVKKNKQGLYVLNEDQWNNVDPTPSLENGDVDGVNEDMVRRVVAELAGRGWNEARRRLRIQMKCKKLYTLVMSEQQLFDFFRTYEKDLCDKVVEWRDAQLEATYDTQCERLAASVREAFRVVNEDGEVVYDEHHGECSFEEFDEMLLKEGPEIKMLRLKTLEENMACITMSYK